MSGTLYVVATPIGNLEDITLRALRVLREVAVIAAEDTRRTGRLLAHYGISTPTLSYHEHNARSRVPQLITRLGAGESVAVVSDAGTPGLSDPGLELVRACVEAGIPVDPIPGASAAVTAIIVSGFPAAPATFRGFPPSKGSARKSWLQTATDDKGTVVIYESPHRITVLLDELAKLSVDRPIMLGREMTKIHQELLRGTASELKLRLKTLRGEFTVVLGPIDSQPKSALETSDLDIALEFCQLTEIARLGRREAISTLAKQYGKSSKAVYALIEAAKNSGE